MIPTAEEFFESKMWVNHKHPNYEDMIEFAKLHVTEALKAAEKSNFIDAVGISITPKSNNLHWTAYGSLGKIVYDKNAILNAYPLENIK